MDDALVIEGFCAALPRVPDNSPRAYTASGAGYDDTAAGYMSAQVLRLQAPYRIYESGNAKNMAMRHEYPV